jgi:hypothetical protein
MQYPVQVRLRWYTREEGGGSLQDRLCEAVGYELSYEPMSYEAYELWGAMSYEAMGYEAVS